MRHRLKGRAAIDRKNELVDYRRAEVVQPGDRAELVASKSSEAGANRYVSAARSPIYDLERKILRQIIDDVGAIDRIFLADAMVDARDALVFPVHFDGRRYEIVVRKVWERQVLRNVFRGHRVHRHLIVRVWIA